jgi:hypothetical protein
MAVIGASPVTFLSEDKAAGKQYQVPLSLLSFDSTGTTIDPSTTWPPYTSLSPNDQGLLKALIGTLVHQGFLTKPPT